MQLSSSSLKLISLLIFISAAHFCVDVMLGIWPIYKSLTKLDVLKAGLIVGVGAFIGEGFQLFFGALSDKGYRKFLIITGLIIAMANAFLVYSFNGFTLFGLFLLTCIGSGCFHPCAASLVNHLLPAHRSLMMAIFAIGGYLGMATSQLAFTYIYPHTYLFILPTVAVALILFYYSFPAVNSHQTTLSYSKRLKELGEFFRNPALRSLYISQVANQSILWGTIFILPDILQELGHNEWTCYGGGHFCFTAGAACIMVPGGYLADIYSARQVMLYGSFVASLIFYFILFTGGKSFILPLLFVLGATLALMNPLAVSLGNQLEPMRSGTVSAFLMGLVWCVSETLGPCGVGVMSSLFSEFKFIKAVAILGGLFIVQIYAILTLPKKLQPVKTYNQVQG